MTIRVVVADDQDLVRTGLVLILDEQPDIEVVGQAADGLEAVEVASRLVQPLSLFYAADRTAADATGAMHTLQSHSVPDAPSP